MISYCSLNISTREIFGTILQEDLLRAFRELQLVPEKTGPVIKPVRRKGYKDKGTWRPPHRWIPKSDYSLNEQQLEIEKRRQSITLLLNYLRHNYQEGC